jgi:hydroxymethylpyrimidine/phosphomethylpyrimidine kinase
VLSIAGSDSGGGAGIQADLKAFAACGVHGMTAITALTAQNTVGVDAIAAVDPQMIVAQVRAVARDIGVDAVKIGMLGTVATIEAVDRALDELDAGVPIVLDPVMVAESGATLLDEAARSALVKRLLPRVTVTTPNLAEAAVLAGFERGDPSRSPNAGGGEASHRSETLDLGDAAGTARANHTLDPADAAELARAIHALGPRCVVVTGGHREQAVDVFFDGEHVVEIPGERHPDGAAHGSGCTHSSVLAAQLALGLSPLAAARAARVFAARAVRDGLQEIGHGPGPVDVLGIRARRAAADTVGAS